MQPSELTQIEAVTVAPEQGDYEPAFSLPFLASLADTATTALLDALQPPARLDDRELSACRDLVTGLEIIRQADEMAAREGLQVVGFPALAEAVGTISQAVTALGGRFYCPSGTTC